ncbi:Integrase [Gemmobacter megaterium]|uniref:Integrase n=1 Tax=Gemmobacter megaterium TaxID=1086013 RepID=A0A1N7QQY1_9RHOB|nr:site-specific integrase [Gemmobacter megaterium]GGE28510.1 integrase [Gemmobacter megaterium]SIT24907.1 Integrase [Gemmobacter megaterium]
MLSNAKAKNLQPGDKALAVGGAPGLWLHPGPARGTGKFVLRFVSPTTRKRRDMGLGTFPETGLADARRLAMEARAQISQGIDPIDQRKSAATSQLITVPSFETAARTVYETLAPGFRNAKHRDQWINSLETYVFPTLGARLVSELTVADFAAALLQIWLTKEETASRVKQRCERVMTWCIANGHASANPLSAVDALLPRQTGNRDRVVHHPAAPWRVLPEIVLDLTSAHPISVSRQALLFLILTAARSGEVREAKWSEIDLETATWTIPPERMKAGRRHRVPLSRQAVALLEGRMRSHLGGELIFSIRGKGAMSDMTITKVLRLRNYESDNPGRPATAHGFRSSFRDWASENGYPRDMAERALAHTIANATEAAYHRTDQLDQRRGMMQAWADYIYSLAPQA